MLKSDRILALDIGASTVKLAEFRILGAGEAELVNYGLGSIPLDSDRDGHRASPITQTIQKLLRERGIMPGPVLVSVAGQSVFQRFVKLPPVASEKVYQIVHYEAQQNVPFPIHEVVWDYQLIEGGEGELDVMLAAVKADLIEELCDAVDQTGLTTDLVDVAPLALYNAVKHTHESLTACTLIIDIGARSTDLIFVDENRYFCRSVPVAGNAITQQVMQEFDLSFTDAEDLKRKHAFVSFGGVCDAPAGETAEKISKIVRSVMTRMHAEINRSISFYSGQQGGRKPTLALLTGGSSLIPHTDIFLKEKLQIEVDYFNPFLNTPVSCEIHSDMLSKDVSVLGQVVGLSLRRVLACPVTIDLMSDKAVAAKDFKRKKPFLVASMLGLLLIVAIYGGYFLRMTALRQERLLSIQDEITSMAALEEKLIPSEEATTVLAESRLTLLRLAHKRTDWLKLTDAILQALPEGLWLTSLSYQDAPIREHPSRWDRTAGEEFDRDINNGGYLEITGFGHVDKIQSENPIRDFRDDLRASPCFTDETKVTWQPLPKPEDNVREFTILLQLAETLFE